MNYNHININERSCIYQFLTLGMKYTWDCKGAS